MMQDSHGLLRQVKDYFPESGPEVIRSFTEGNLHKDFQNELLARIEDMRDFNEECSSKEYLETRGGIKALRLTMDIFHDLLNNKIVDSEEDHDGR